MKNFELSLTFPGMFDKIILNQYSKAGLTVCLSSKVNVYLNDMNGLLLTL